LVVVAQKHNGEKDRQVKALNGVRAITGRVAEVVDGGNSLAPGVRKHCLECLQVGMRIAEDCLHATPPPPQSGALMDNLHGRGHDQPIFLLKKNSSDVVRHFNEAKSMESIEISS
jgi:hypothetical protein